MLVTGSLEGEICSKLLSGIELSRYKIVLPDNIVKEMDLDAFVKQQEAAAWNNNDDDVPILSTGEGLRRKVPQPWRQFLKTI